MDSSSSETVVVSDDAVILTREQAERVLRALNYIAYPGEFSRPPVLALTSVIREQVQS